MARHDHGLIDLSEIADLNAVSAAMSEGSVFGSMAVVEARKKRRWRRRMFSIIGFFGVM